MQFTLSVSYGMQQVCSVYYRTRSSSKIYKSDVVILTSLEYIQKVTQDMNTDNAY